MNQAQSANLKLAVLIDADNTSADIIEPLLEEIGLYGTASVRRIYGNWKGTRLKKWDDVLLSNAITPIHVIDYTKGKNSSDIGLVIDAMDLLYSETFDIFCLVSSDSDFTRLALRIRESGKAVYGFGEQKTPESFRKACDKFIYLENLLIDENPSDDEPLPIKEYKQASTNKQQTTIDNKPTSTNKAKTENKQPNIKAPSKKTAKQLSSDGALVKLIREAVTKHADDSGYAFLSPIGQYMNNVNSDFDSRNYGYPRLSELILAMKELFDTEMQNGQLKVRKAKKKK